MSEIAYDHNQIELKWQDRWNASDLYRADPDSAAPKYYVVEMLPYPSGRLHMGHVRNYAIGDALARYMWMRGYNVRHPMGWDAFGLPAENAAIKSGTHPREWTLSRIAEMKRQMRRIGFSYDWNLEATTCANEQVVDGCCWRHESTPVEQRAMEQWFWKITAYVDELLHAINGELE